MKRTQLKFLEDWKNSNNRKPLIINGARQVGKTWLMEEFAQTNYTNFVYLNFEEKDSLKEIFESDLDVRKIIQSISIRTGIEIYPAKTLLIFDEIQLAPRALTSLKYFNEEANEYHVISAGSLLGLSLHQGNSFPVGKVDFLDLYPFDFVEFLDAIGEVKIKEIILNLDFDLIKVLGTRLQELLRQYYFIGGMPKAIKTFIETNNYDEVRSAQKSILRSYEFDFSKHAPAAIVPRIKMLWDSIPSQLSKDNKKFIYNAIKSGARAKDYELALAWLIEASLVHKIHNVSIPKIPLKLYEEIDIFKLFLSDVGLFGAKVESDPKLILTSNNVFKEFKGSLTEQYVLQQLKAKNIGSIYYWSPTNLKSEVDFVLEHSAEVWPIEVKAEENLLAKSLKVFTDKYNPKYAIRTSMSDYRKGEKIINIPLYCIGELYNILNKLY